MCFMCDRTDFKRLQSLKSSYRNLILSVIIVKDCK